MAKTKYQCRVKSTVNPDFVGIVIAEYDIYGVTYLDIRLDDEDKIFYGAKSANWAVVATEEEMEQ